MKKLFIICLFAVVSPLYEFQAQTPQSDKIQKTNEKFVSVPVSVSDREGRYIADLKKEDFALYQNGVEQKITFFARYDEPLNIALLLDTSGSTSDSLQKIKDATEEFIDLLNPNDQCLIATFDAKLQILNEFSSNPQILKKSLNKINTAETDGTILHNAIDQISRTKFAGIQGRKVIILLSDGKDLGSSLTKTQLLNELEESDVLIYSIFYDTTETSGKVIVNSDEEIDVKKKKKQKVKKPKKQKGYVVSIPAQQDQPNEVDIEIEEKKAELQAVNSLKEISDLTAGRFYLSDTPGLKGVFRKVAGELRQQYRLGYELKDPAKSSARQDIIVKVKRPDAVVQTRRKVTDK